jgi:hypothetical protein
MADSSVPASWSAARFFDLLACLGRLRVVSICGPSVFESLCEVDRYHLADGHLNAITDAYHWHLALDRFRYLRSHDAVHARSGRRVLFFELRSAADAPAFLRIYVHREKGVEFEPDREARFVVAHAELAHGQPVVMEVPPR